MDIGNVEPEISHEVSVETAPLLGIYPARPRTLYPLPVTARIFTVAVESTIIEF